MGKLGGYVRLMRPINCLMVGFAIIVGAGLASPHELSDYYSNLFYGVITGFSLTGASMAINDYYDREIDAINEPSRPIPSGLIRPREAVTFALILTAVGFSFAYLTNILCFFIAVGAWIIFVVYTTIGKRTGLLGNFLVSICVGISFIYGSSTIAGTIELNVLLFASLAFISNTGREITKGIVDVLGDRASNIKTLAVRYGERTAAVAASFFNFFAVLLSPLPWLLNLVSFWFIPIVVIFDFGLAASSFILLRDYSRENARRIKNIALLLFIIGLLAFMIGAVWRPYV